MGLFENHLDDADYLHRWLEAASEVGVASNQRAHSSEEQAALGIVADAAIDAVLESKDSDNVEAVIQRAVSKAVQDTQVKHTAIKSFANLAVKGVSAKAMRSVFKTLKKANTLSEGEKAKRATCVVRSGYALSLVFQAASDIHDSVVTCPHSMHAERGNFLNNTRGQVCAINVGEANLDLFALAAVLSSLSEDCSSSLIPNVDRLCAASVTGFLTSFAQFAGLGVLFEALCGPHHPPPPPGVTPSNLGDMDQDPQREGTLFPYLDFHGWARGYHLHERDPQDVANDPAAAAAKAQIEADAAAHQRHLQATTVESAPARKLLYGGGRASTGIQCFVDVSDIVWFLAQAGLSISSASGHTGLLGGCPPKNIFGGDRVKGKVYHWAEIYCMVDVAGAIAFMLAVASFIQFSVVNCGDVLNIPAICGAATTGIFSAAASTAQTAMGLHLVCDPQNFQNPHLKKLVELGRDLDMKSGNKISHLLGRRLEDVYEDPVLGINALKKRFGTPEEAWKSIGWDLSSPPANLRAELRAHAPKRKLSQQDFKEVVLGEMPLLQTTRLFETSGQCF